MTSYHSYLQVEGILTGDITLRANVTMLNVTGSFRAITREHPAVLSMPG